MNNTAAHRARIGLAAAISAAVLAGLAACDAATVPDEPDEAVSRASEAAPTAAGTVSREIENQAILESIAAAEQANEPKYMELYPGMYSDITITGAVEGATSVLRYEYTYSTPVDWAAGSPQLDLQRPTLESTCKTLLFPNMEKAGIIGAIEIVYFYTDPVQSGSWEHICTQG
jgi:hypothetical protein